MKMIDKVMEELQEQGFRPKMDGRCIFFKFQMLKYMFLNHEDDEEYFSLYAPCIFQVDDENRMDVYQAINNVNDSIRAAKMLIYEEEVWAAYECYCTKDADLSNLVPIAVATLFKANQSFFEELKSI